MSISARIRAPLDGAQFEIVVIGGGINGVAIARECARAGRKTLLIERHDFGSGTTSRSTRIIHGGLRYLEHGDIGLVRESLRERQRLLRERPHLVRPMNFLLAMGPQASRSALEIRFGLWLYRKFAGSRTGARTDDAEIARLERLLDAGRTCAVFPYDDAQCEFPERLVAEWLAEALASGAEARNYTELLAIETSRGRARAARLRDLRDGSEARVEATWFVNATGPWADRICRESCIDTRKPMVGGVRGSHIVLPRFPGAPESTIYAEAADGRPIFVVPWSGQLLVGTTEVPDDGDPAMAQPSEAETEYLFDFFVKLFPTALVTWNDVRYSFAGVRPLPFVPGSQLAAVTRRHILHDHTGDAAAGMISVIGGKLTTAASLARACARKMGIRAAEPNPVAVAVGPTDGIASSVREWSRHIAATTGLSESTAMALAQWHGPHAMAVARLAAAHEGLRRPLCPHTVHIVAEAVEAVQNECAVSLADVLLRRVPVALGSCWSDECGQMAARVIGDSLGWTEYETAQQLETFESERRRFLRAPQRAGSRISAGSAPVKRAA